MDEPKYGTRAIEIWILLTLFSCVDCVIEIPF